MFEEEEDEEDEAGGKLWLFHYFTWCLGEIAYIPAQNPYMPTLP